MATSAKPGGEFQRAVAELNRLCLEIVSIAVGHPGIGSLSSRIQTPTPEQILAATNCVPRVVEIRNRMESLLGDFGAELRSFGHERQWEATVHKLIEPGYHLALARYVCERMVPSQFAMALRESPFTPTDDVTYFLKNGPVCGALHFLIALVSTREHLRYSLEREALDLAKVAPIGPGSAPGARFEINHRLRRVALLGDRMDEFKLTRTRVDYLVLCLLAFKKNTWFQTHDFKELAGIGNPSEVHRGLEPAVRALIVKGNRGRRTGCDGNVVEQSPLQGGREIQWGTLHIGDPVVKQLRPR